MTTTMNVSVHLRLVDQLTRNIRTTIQALQQFGREAQNINRIATGSAISSQFNRLHGQVRGLAGEVRALARAPHGARAGRDVDRDRGQPLVRGRHDGRGDRRAPGIGRRHLAHQDRQAHARRPRLLDRAAGGAARAGQPPPGAGSCGAERDLQHRASVARNREASSPLLPLEAQDAMGAWLAESCEVKSTFQEKASRLYGSWKAYADRVGETPGSIKTFGPTLESRGFPRAPSRRAGSVYQGLRLIADEEQPPSYWDR